MTHAELRAGRNAGLEPTSCPLDVALVEALIDEAEPNRPTVDIYRCGCGHTIPVDHVTGRVRNDYPDPRRIGVSNPGRLRADGPTRGIGPDTAVSARPARQRSERWSLRVPGPLRIRQNKTPKAGRRGFPGIAIGDMLGYTAAQGRTPSVPPGPPR